MGKNSLDCEKLSRWKPETKDVKCYCHKKKQLLTISSIFGILPGLQIDTVSQFLSEDCSTHRANSQKLKNCPAWHLGIHFQPGSTLTTIQRWCVYMMYIFLYIYIYIIYVYVYIHKYIYIYIYINMYVYINISIYLYKYIYIYIYIILYSPT